MTSPNAVSPMPTPTSASAPVRIAYWRRFAAVQVAVLLLAGIVASIWRRVRR